MITYASKAAQKRAAGSFANGVLVPGLKAYLKNVGTGAKSRPVRTDLAGRFTFPPVQKPGSYRVCWSGFGFVSGCSNAFAVMEEHVHLGPIPIQVRTELGAKAFYGRVQLADRTVPQAFDPVANVNAHALVKAVIAGQPSPPQAYVNDFGDYVLPLVPTGSAIKLQAHIEGAAAVVPVAGGAPSVQRVDLTIQNNPPSISGIVASAPSGKHWTANPGDSITLTAQGADPNGDALSYRWTMPDGSSVLNAAGGATVTYQLPNLPGNYGFEVVAYDERGGYAKDVITIVTKGVHFAGVVKATDAPFVSGAEVEINGTPATTDASGAFSLFVDESDRYVLNIRKAGYGLVSKIYDNGLTGGVWTLTRATVATVDPSQPIVVTSSPQPRDCPGSLSDQARRRGKPPKECNRGIRVRIPPNSLVDGSGNTPAGPVQVGLTTVDLGAPDGMPGDYTAESQNGDQRVMESYGAGTVSISAGGQHYNLASGTKAEVTIPIDPSQLTASTPPPATIPLLSYDEGHGVWVEEAAAKRVGNDYVGLVSHFSAINTDLLKVNQACVRLDATAMPSSLIPAASPPTSFVLQVTIPTSSGASVTRTASLDNSAQRFHVLYNLPTNVNLELRAFANGSSPTPIDLIQLPPANPPVSTPVLIVNTGGPQNPTSPNLPAFPYGACQNTAELVPFTLPADVQHEFLYGLSFNAENLNFLSASNAGLARVASQNYYTTIDPQGLRQDLTDFKTKNGFGSGSGSEVRARYANSGDLGFGRDMHCHKTGADVACYVTNYGDRFTNDVQDFRDAVDDNGQIATVGMEYSQVEDATGTGFQAKTGGGVLRIVKFYVFVHAKPSPVHTAQGDGRVESADLDGFGQRPVPALCMVCHGGRLPAGVTAPTPGAYSWNTADANSADLGSNFIPFDISGFSFTPSPYNGVDKASEQAPIKLLNEDYVEATLAAGPHPTRDVITAMYASGSTQSEDFVVSGWTGTGISANQEETYKKVVGPSCRSCHISQAYSDITWDTATKFKNRRFPIDSFVCQQHIMPHAKVTHNNFWLSVTPHQPPILRTFLTNVGGGSLGAQCSP